MDKHSPSARWKQKFQWRELLLRALKPKNIYFRKIPELAVIFHILSFFFEARGQLWQSLWADPLSWFWLCFCLALVHRMSNYLHPGCLPGRGMGQKYSRAGATTCVACFHWPVTAAQSKPVVPKLLAWSGSRQGASCRQWLFWLRKHFVPSAADLLLSRPSVQPLLEKRNCSLCSLSCLAVLPFGQTCCPFPGLHININCLRQLPNPPFIVLQSSHSFPWHGQCHLFCMNGADPASGTSPHWARDRVLQQHGCGGGFSHCKLWLCPDMVAFELDWVSLIHHFSASGSTASDSHGVTWGSFWLLVASVSVVASP